ncbi:hypothetical protein OSB04_011700 [Centaurea solstitialis]|uniref:Retrotransposon gag domain-containing protein n=1 Tax=Centaurea solstitialis TaxID=347529 RepID=A0AA38TN20_9ASTR|nr:hypothetical protein OSB04_011700 [Centaurea solstitialis]
MLSEDILGRWFRNVKSKRRLRDMTRDACKRCLKFGDYLKISRRLPNSFCDLESKGGDCWVQNRIVSEITKLAQSEDKGKVKVVFKVKNLNLEQQTHKAREWYNSLQPDSVITWNQMAEKFLKKYFPPLRNAQSRNDICSFQQLDGEAVPTAWERFKELLRKCPHHGIPYCIQLETFYNGLNEGARQMLDATAGGAFTARSYNEGYIILERISNNNGHWVDPRSIPNRSSGCREADSQAVFVSKLSDIMAAAIRKLTTEKQVVSIVHSSETTELPVQCTYCGGDHLFDACPGNPEQVNYVGSNNFRSGPFSPTYNPGWRQHPNLSWNNPTLNPQLPKLQGQSHTDNYRQSNFQNQGQSNFQNQKRVHFQDEEAPRFQNTQHTQNPPQSSFKYQRSQTESSGSLESMMKGFMT